MRTRGSWSMTDDLFPSLLTWSRERQVAPLRFTECQWIADEPGPDDGCKCRRPVADPEAEGPRGSYCEAHARKAKQRRRRAVDLEAAEMMAGGARFRDIPF